MWLRSGSVVAVAVAGSCSSDSTPSLGIAICCRCGPKMKKSKKKRKKNELVNGLSLSFFERLLGPTLLHWQLVARNNGRGKPSEPRVTKDAHQSPLWPHPFIPTGRGRKEGLAFVESQPHARCFLSSICFQHHEAARGIRLKRI